MIVITARFHHYGGTRTVCLWISVGSLRPTEPSSAEDTVRKQ